MFEVAPCNQLQPHEEHVYEWSKYSEYVWCPGHEDDRRYQPKKRWWHRLRRDRGVE